MNHGTVCGKKGGRPSFQIEIKIAILGDASVIRCVGIVGLQHVLGSFILEGQVIFIF